ncbi:hypothetical protein BDZ91DRAFT_760287 [Kalaharituber pfeilii]|nr:hypothetical protein BDZ91DRAFT_760287 [Kalaharituber pfeilii]
MSPVRSGPRTPEQVVFDVSAQTAGSMQELLNANTFAAPQHPSYRGSQAANPPPSWHHRQPIYRQYQAAHVVQQPASGPASQTHLDPLPHPGYASTGALSHLPPASLNQAQQTLPLEPQGYQSIAPLPPLSEVRIPQQTMVYRAPTTGNVNESAWGQQALTIPQQQQFENPISQAYIPIDWDASGVPVTYKRVATGEIYTSAELHEYLQMYDTAVRLAMSP